MKNLLTEQNAQYYSVKFVTKHRSINYWKLQPFYIRLPYLRTVSYLQRVDSIYQLNHTVTFSLSCVTTDSSRQNLDNFFFILFLPPLDNWISFAGYFKSNGACGQFELLLRCGR